MGDTFRSSSGSFYKSTGLTRRARINLVFCGRLALCDEPGGVPHSGPEKLSPPPPVNDLKAPGGIFSVHGMTVGVQVDAPPDFQAPQGSPLAPSPQVEREFSERFARASRPANLYFSQPFKGLGSSVVCRLACRSLGPPPSRPRWWDLWTGPHAVCTGHSKTRWSACKACRLGSWPHSTCQSDTRAG